MAALASAAVALVTVVSMLLLVRIARRRIAFRVVPNAPPGALEAARTPLGVVCAECVRVHLRGRMPNVTAGVYGEFDNDRSWPTDLARCERRSVSERLVRGLRSRCAHIVEMSITSCR